MTGLLLLVLGGLAGLSWWQLVKGRELARQIASGICKAYGFSLMDDTVVLDTVARARDDSGYFYGLRYRFDFAEAGILRQGSTVLIAAGRPSTVVLKTREGDLIEEIL